MKATKEMETTKRLLPIIAFGIFPLFFSCTMSNNEESMMETPDGWQLLWNDEFSDEAVDTSKWEVEEYSFRKGAFKAENVLTEDNALIFRSTIEDTMRYGGRVMSKELFAPPARIEIRFKPVMKPGSFIALWMYPTVRDTTTYADYNKQIYKEFDFLECGGGENIVTDDDIKIIAHTTVHSWYADYPRVPGTNVRAQVNVAPQISVGNPEEWQELRFDWDNQSSANGNEARFYWRTSGADWGEPIFTVKPDRSFFKADSKMNQFAFDSVKFVEILNLVWNDAMAINMFSHPRGKSAWLSQESLAQKGLNTWGGSTLDPADYPFDMEIDYVRVFIPDGDARLLKD